MRRIIIELLRKNKKDFFLCDRDIIKKAFKNCKKSIKNMNQKGGYNNIVELKNKINILDKILFIPPSHDSWHFQERPSLCIKKLFI